MFTRQLLFSTVAASALGIGAVAVQAADAPMQRAARSLTVDVRDLNLSDSRAVANLYQRLHKAADRVCSSRAFTGLYYTYRDYRGCVADSLQGAVSSVHSTALDAYYQQQLTESRTIRVAEK